MVYFRNQWYGWEGGVCPLPKGTIVEARFAGETHTKRVEDLDWSTSPYGVVAFKIKSGVH